MKKEIQIGELITRNVISVDNMHIYQQEIVRLKDKIEKLTDDNDNLQRTIDRLERESEKWEERYHNILVGGESGTNWIFRFAIITIVLYIALWLFGYGNNPLVSFPKAYNDVITSDIIKSLNTTIEELKENE